MDAQAFGDIVLGTFNRMYPTLTDEKMMCNPARAHAFCDVIREAIASPDVPDETILQCLINRRKNSTRGEPQWNKRTRRSYRGRTLFKS
jgi:hypothetical protein